MKDCRGKLFKEKVFPCTPFKNFLTKKIIKGIAHLLSLYLYLVGDDLPGVPNNSAQTGRRGRRPPTFLIFTIIFATNEGEIILYYVEIMLWKTFCNLDFSIFFTYQKIENIPFFSAL